MSGLAIREMPDYPCWVGPIAVEMPPAPADQAERPVHEAALLRACSEASSPLRCVRASEVEGSADIIAVVSWDGELTVRLEVAERAQGRWLERTLTFANNDPEIERWEAAGLAIGTLLSTPPERETKDAEPEEGGQALPPESPTLQKETPAKEPWRERPTDASQGSASRRRPGPAGPILIYGDVGFDVGSAWGDTLKFGPSALVGTRLRSGLFFDADFDFAWSHNENVLPGASLESTWWGAGLGAGMSWQAGPGTLAEVGLFPGLENIQTSVRGGGSPPARVVGHVEGKLRLRQRLVGHFWLRLSANFGVRLGETEIFVAGSPVGTIPLIYGGLNLSTSFDLLQLQGPR